MNTGIVAVRYAKALLGYADDKAVDGEVYQYMKVLCHSYQHTPALRGAVDNRLLDVAQRSGVLWTACGGDPRVPPDETMDPASGVLGRFFTLLLRQNRADLMQSVALQYIDLYRQAHHIIYGMLVTPVAVDKATAFRAEALLRSRAIENGTIELEYAIDPQLIGGFRLETDREVLDVSVAAALQRARKAWHIAYD